jgi:ADP-L-glycero-D-manno-heptose 6-epimerase
MILITGAAGFIGSCMVRHLNEAGREDLVLVDDFSPMPVETCHGASLHCDGASLQDVKYLEKIPRDFFFDWLDQNHSKVDFIIHLGSEIDTLPEDTVCFHEHILEFSQRLWSFAAMNRIPLLYAASSADNSWENLACLNDKKDESGIERRGLCEKYKQTFDLWVMKQRITPPLWAGFRMVEVYGPGENLMGGELSSVMRIVRQIHQQGKLVIPCFSVSEMVVDEVFTDRILIKDVVTIFTWFMNHLPASGIYRIATGYPRPISAVAKLVFSALKKEEKMEFVQMTLTEKSKLPKLDNISVNSLRSVGYKKNYASLEDGIRKIMREMKKNQTF